MTTTSTTTTNGNNNQRTTATTTTTAATTTTDDDDGDGDNDDDDSNDDGDASIGYELNKREDHYDNKDGVASIRRVAPPARIVAQLHIPQRLHSVGAASLERKFQTPGMLPLVDGWSGRGRGGQ